MFNKIISMPETMYLGFGIMIPWDNNLEIQFNFWREAFASGRINKLKKLCGSEQVVGIFCYKCDMEMQTFSYHIACENKLNASNPDFDELRLVALDFACFKNNCTDANQRFDQYNALCDEIWGSWLPDSDYISLIEPETLGCVEGYALLEIYTPENPTTGSYTLEMFLPIKSKLL